MAAGVECYDQYGNLTFSATDSLGRVLGIFNVNGATNGGTYNDAALLRGRPFALFFSDGSGYAHVNCTTQVSGQTISWSYGGAYANTGNNPSGFIVYGIY
jgi:hypothetical protein